MNNLYKEKTGETPRKASPDSVLSTTKLTLIDHDVNSAPQRWETSVESFAPRSRAVGPILYKLFMQYFKLYFVFEIKETVTARTFLTTSVPSSLDVKVVILLRS